MLERSLTAVTACAICETYVIEYWILPGIGVVTIGTFASIVTGRRLVAVATRAIDETRVVENRILPGIGSVTVDTLVSEMVGRR